MTATEKLTSLYREVMTEKANVAKEYSTLAQSAELMTRHNVSRIDDAMTEEAKRRVFSR